MNLSNLLQRRTAEDKNRALDKAAQAYRAQCSDRAQLLERQFTLGKIKSWDDLKIQGLPAAVSCQPLTFLALKSYLVAWVASAEARFKVEEQARQQATAEVSTKFVNAESTTGVRQVGQFTLKPRQRKAVDLAVEKLREGSTQAVVIPLEGGEGKSVIGWALVKYWQDNNWFGHPVGKLMLNQALFDTKPPVVINMTRRGIACGVQNLNRGVLVVSHTMWATKEWKHFFREVEVEHYGQRYSEYRYILPPPAIIIIDECQDYKKPKSRKSRYLRAIVEAGVEAGSVFIFMSATPWVTIEDTWLFCLATGREWMGERISMQNFPHLAKAIASRAGCSPRDNSPKAMMEFRKAFNDCHIIPPRDPREFKAYNDVMLVEFENDRDREFYAKTMERYYDELARCGKGDTTVNKMTAFLKLRHSEERIKCPYFARLARASHARGFAPVIGVTSQDAVKEITRLLVYEHGVPRDKISIVWGGDKIVTREHIVKLVGEEIFTQIGLYLPRYYQDRDSLSESEISAIRKYLKWAKEQVRYQENDETQALRHEELVKLRLDKQTLEQRQDEIDRFQNGTTEYCIFTLSAGGTGVDLDHQNPTVRPREGFFTICYWAEEFMQALYRTMRIATLSNVHQHMVFFKDTIVANHVAPRLDAKIKAIRAGISAGPELADETIELLGDHVPTNMHSISQADLKPVEDDGEFDADAALAKIEDDDEED